MKLTRKLEPNALKELEPLKDNIGAFEIFDHPALEFGGRPTNWKLMHDKLFDFSKDGNR